MYKLKAFITFTLITLANIVHCQENRTDTITLQEVKISKKEPKIITLKKGKGKTRIGNGFFKTAPEGAYLIEKIPYGTIQEITLHFNSMQISTDPNHIPVAKTEATTYELTLHELKDNKMGPAINDVPIIIQLPASKKDSQNIKIDLTTLHLNTDRFFAIIKRTSVLPCSDCNFYIPVNYISEKQLYFNGYIKSIRLKEDTTQVQYPNFHSGLLCEIKTRTREY